MAKMASWSGAVTLGIALLATWPMAARAADERTPGKDEQSFLKDAASGGMMEVELGRIATTHASDQRVKQFGQRMVDDHTKANTALKQVATKESVNLPSTLTDEQRDEVSRLSKMKGPEFDRAYMQAMVKDHEEDVDKFRTQSKSAKDTPVKNFAAQTLPTLESHLQMAKDINGSIEHATSGARTGERQ